MSLGFRVTVDLNVTRPALPRWRPQGAVDRGTTAPPHAWRTCAILMAISILLLIGSDVVLAAFPVHVHVTATEQAAAISIDGVTRIVDLAGPLQSARFVPIEPNAREYQIDGSDTANNSTFQGDYFATFANSPYYHFQSWLRDEGSYSVWQNLQIRDAVDHPVVQQAQPAADEKIAVPAKFDLAVDLHRMEAPRAIEFSDNTPGVLRIQLNRNDKYARVIRATPDAPEVQLARWYLPLDWPAALAELFYLLLRSCAIALLLVLLGVALTAFLPARTLPTPNKLTRRLALAGALLAALAASLYISVALFDRAPTIYDGMSYYFQAKTFAAGLLAAPKPLVPKSFPLPFTVLRDDKWFSMYTPGTALMLMPGFRLGVPWLVEPLLAIAAIALTYGFARRQFGTSTALMAAILMASSPFLHLQSGTYMSHVPGMFWAAVLLYGATRYRERPAIDWATMVAVALGMLFLTREMSAILYALVLGPVLLRRVYGAWWEKTRSPRRLLGDAVLVLGCLAIFAGAYLAYNQTLTGSAQLLPRVLFSATENRYGFGEEIGFYGRHTLGGGLINADEALTSLTIILFGWPFYVSLGCLLLPFLLRRAQSWDLIYGAITASFILAYIGLYYHGIAYGPRYYFDALPALVLLTARGIVALTVTAAAICQRGGRTEAWPRAKTAAIVLCTVLLACNAVYFWPQQTRLYQSRSNRAGVSKPALGSFIQPRLNGRVSTLHAAVVVTRDAGLMDIFQPLNCPRLDCDTIFAFAPDDPTEQRLRAAFPGREWYRVWDQDGVLTIAPMGQLGSPPSQ